MTVLHVPLCRAQSFVLARLTSFNCDAGDLRWTVLGFAVLALNAVCAFGHRQISLWAQAVLRRAWQGARFAAEMHDADSMVAAGGQ